MGGRLRAFIALFALPALLSSTPAHAECERRMLELPVKMVGLRAVATVGINGTPVPLTVDSGAFFSFLTDAAAAQLKLPLVPNFGMRIEGLTGRVDTSLTRVDRLKLFNGELSQVDFVVGGNEPGAGTLGLMGRNMLSVADTEYDLAHGMIRLGYPNRDCAGTDLAYWAAAGSAAVTRIDLLTDVHYGRTPATRAEVKLNGKTLVALLDTGATTLVSTTAARRAGVSGAAMKAAGTARGSGRGSVELFTAGFDKLQIGDETIDHPDLHVADFDTDGADLLLGIDFFLSHRIYVSRQQSKIYLTYNGGPVLLLDKRDAAGPDDPGAGSVAGASEPATAEQLARLAAASAARGNLPRALADLNRALVLDPASAELYAQRAGVEARSQQPTQALADLDKSLALDPTQADARISRARLRLAAKDREGSAADLEVLRQAVPPQSQMRLSMAYLYIDLDQAPPALEQLDQWLPAHPHEAGRESVLNSRCWLRARLGTELDAAQDDCNQAVAANPKNPNYWGSRGWLRLRLGRFAEARADFDRSLAIRPEGPWSLYGRALAGLRLGDAAESEADLATARRLRPDIDLLVTRAGLMTAPSASP